MVSNILQSGVGEPCGPARWVCGGNSIPTWVWWMRCWIRWRKIQALAGWGCARWRWKGPSS